MCRRSSIISILEPVCVRVCVYVYVCVRLNKGGLIASFAGKDDRTQRKTRHERDPVVLKRRTWQHCLGHKGYSFTKESSVLCCIVLSSPVLHCRTNQPEWKQRNFRRLDKGGMQRQTGLKRAPLGSQTWTEPKSAPPSICPSMPKTQH